MRRILLLVAVFTAQIPVAMGADLMALASGNWSDHAIWGGTLPGIEDDVMIPAGMVVTLDADVECGGIMVEGILEVERANRTLLCDTLMVQGADAAFRVGTSANRFEQNFTLTLKGLATETPMPMMGAKFLAAHNGGTLDIHGRDRVEWTKLAASVSTGATSMTLAEPVDWVVGDRILVTSSRKSASEAETRTITGVSADSKTVYFATGLTHPHNGSQITKTRPQNPYSDSKSWTADLRAEVGLLSRNVKIEGDAASEIAGFGGHIMVMNGGAACCATSGKGFIEGVELFRMGQKFRRGRYPMHWHMLAEDGAGQYFRDNVVNKSFNRAIVIHGTESALVENNLCYDHIGHGIFLEDGSERFNIIRRNVVLLTKKPAENENLLDSDRIFSGDQNASPASYWITNPNNIFTDNIAAGTEGTGYWFAFPQQPLRDSLTHPSFIGLKPYEEPLGEFKGNTAHSCTNGLDINDQLSASDTLVLNGEWRNAGPFTFENCTFYANRNGIYAGIGGKRDNVIYYNNVFADNQVHLFLATYQICEESLMIADTGLGLLPATQTRTAYAVYDGAGRMTKNHLVGYDGTYSRFLGNIGAATKHPNHRFDSLTFDPPTPPRSVLTNYNIISPPDIRANDAGHPRMWAQVILDVNGSISGVPNSSIISNHPFMLTGGETRPSVWTNMYRSSHRFAQWAMTYAISDPNNYPNVSAVRTMAGTPTRGVYYINGYKGKHQLPLIVREDFLYTYFYETLPTSRKVDMTFDDADVGDFVVIRYKDFGKLPGLEVSGSGMTSQPSLALMKDSTTSSYYKEDNGDLYVRPVATGRTQTYQITWTEDIPMPEVDSDGDDVSDGAEAAAGTDPFRSVDGTDPFRNSEFNVANNFERWDLLGGITNETVAGGALSARSGTTVPQIVENNLRVSGTAVPYLLVRMKAPTSTTARFLWGRLGAESYTAGRSVSSAYTTPNQWRVLVFPMAGQADWQNQVITNLRFDAVNSTGADFQVDWIRASSGDLDGDGLSDVFEGDGDLDQDGLLNLEDPDSDGDGIPDAADPQPDTSSYDNDQDGIPDTTDPDDDNDGTPDVSDAFPVDPAEQTDTDLDGVGDRADAFPANSSEQVDTDGDGIGNNADTDDDGDGMSDTAELSAGRNPLNVLDLNFGFNTAAGFEGWTRLNIAPSEVSGGVLKGTSSTGDPQLERSGFTIKGNSVNQVVVKMKAGVSGGTLPAGKAQLFWGRVGAPSNTGTRSVSVSYGPVNTWRALFLPVSTHAEWANHTITSLRFDPFWFTNTALEIDWIRVSNGDLDGDGISDTTEGTGDTDGDGLLNVEDLDSDGDGLPDATDTYPYLSSLLDLDNDGIPDASDTDDDGDGVADASDAFPRNANEQLDSDDDGIGNNADTDDDNDGTPDAEDAFPLNATEQLDTDGDSIGNNADPDDDNDGTPDAEDAFPLDAAEQLDSDGDGIGNNADTDDDNDLVADAENAFPLDPTEQLDTDGDGIGNDADTDDDNDGLSDALETSHGLSTLEPIHPALDTDADGQSDLFEIHAGIDFRNLSDRFEWSVAKASASPAQVVLPVKPGRTYRILACDDLSEGAWQELESLHPDTAGNHTFTDPASVTRRFYRVEIRIDPP